jgi:hypothetical protein
MSEANNLLREYMEAFPPKMEVVILSEVKNLLKFYRTAMLLNINKSILIVLNTSKNLHIVSLNIPYPPNYGGVIDIFYKIKALFEAGYSIHLHTFKYNRESSKDLEKYCKSVHYYKRKTGLISFLSLLPYIVYSRRSKALIENLLKNDYPILFEGLHCCYYLGHPGLANHKKYIRTHNIEHNYYRALSKFSRNYFESFYFLLESIKLKRYEKILHKADKILAISPGDKQYFSEKYGKTEWLSAFHSCDEVSSLPGRGKYIMMHGNLAVKENEGAVIYAMKEIFCNIDFPVIIAGRNPSSYLTGIIRKNPRVVLIDSPDDDRLDQLIRDAHIHMMIAFQETGLKLKLINVLFKGRFVVVNPPMVNGTGLAELVLTGRNPEQLIHLINENLNREFDSQQIIKRQIILKAYSIQIGRAHV